MTKDTMKEAAVAAENLLFNDWVDAIEDGVRSRVRGFIETMLEEELDGVLSRPRYGRRKPNDGEGAPMVVGCRHGHRQRTLTGTFGKTQISVPRARLVCEDQGGKTREWKSRSLRAYQRRTRAADALIAGAYLSGTNTRRVRRALQAVFAGTVGKDVVSRTWRKVKGDWDVWNQRSLADQKIIRLILDGTVVRVRLDKKATSISLLVALGMRAAVTILDKSLPRLRELDARFGGHVRTLASSTDALEREVAAADVVIGAVLIPGAAAPKLVTDKMVASMRPGSVLIDIAIDQGGCFETSRPTTHSEPTYVVHGVTHYCVTNMPGAVPRTSAFALNAATLPYVKALADRGMEAALAADAGLAAGLNVSAGKITSKAVAEALGL